jgi:hypothetical protein
MKGMRKFLRVVGLLPLFVAPVFAASPEVFRVEPPTWWSGHSHNPVRVLFTGTNLVGAEIKPSTGFTISNLLINPAGTYVFCDVFIPPDAPPATHEFKVATVNGTTTASFAIVAALPKPNRFTGFSPDDVIYLLMPDRFANGDPANDDPAVSPRAA